MVARELIVLAARELVVVVLVILFVAWVAYRFVRESRR
jgi:cbb3-type cytochrome oxidase subunit 3